MHGVPERDRSRAVGRLREDDPESVWPSRPDSNVHREMGEVGRGRADLRELGLVPKLVRTHPVVGTRRDLVDDLREAEIGVDLLELRGVGHALVEDLILGAEDMGVVLGETADTQQPVKHAATFVAIHGAQFGEAYRRYKERVPRYLLD